MERILGHKALENVSVKGVKRNMGVYKRDKEIIVRKVGKGKDPRNQGQRKL